MLTNFWRSIKSANEVWREVVSRNVGGRPEIAQLQHDLIFIEQNVVGFNICVKDVDFLQEL